MIGEGRNTFSINCEKPFFYNNGAQTLVIGLEMMRVGWCFESNIDHLKNLDFLKMDFWYWEEFFWKN